MGLGLTPGEAVWGRTEHYANRTEAALVGRALAL